MLMNKAYKIVTWLHYFINDTVYYTDKILTMSFSFDNTFFDAVRPYLLKLALMQIHHNETAEEIVQDAMLAAVEGAANFSGNSSPRTWITGILKHKIMDHLRKKYRADVVSLDDETTFDKPLFETLFKDNGHWRSGARPENWERRRERFSKSTILASAGILYDGDA